MRRLSVILQDAAAVLPAKSGASDNGRATNAAANALLGRVLMQKGDYAGAKTALLKIPTPVPMDIPYRQVSG